MTPEHQVLLSAVGAAVRRLRDERSLTRRELAGKSGVSERFLAELEAGQGNISVARLQDVARALGSSAGELLFSAQHERTERRVVALIGLRGAGKSTIGRALANRMKVPFVELDALVEKDAGLPLSAIFQLHGEAYYRRLAREVLTRFLAETDAAVLATGGGIVTDPASFRLLQRRCRTVWLQATPEDHWERVLRQGDVRPGAGSPHAQEELRALLKARESLYSQAELAVDTSRLGINGAVEEIARRVAA
jgi:XRE family transcriptional regulator, aerobic/anaerobic benzoate catabolism transcriptional regulator